MQRAEIPAKFRIPFAESAGGSFRREVPIPSQIGLQDGAASFTTGFPPDNFSPIAAGGVPPFGADVNGLLFQMSGWDRWFFSGGPVTYDSVYAAEIGGYPEGAIVASVSVLGRFYLCLVDDNVTNPDAAGAGWKAFSFNTSVNGQCYFQFATATTAKLMPRNGNAIVIAGVPYEIPTAGVTLDLTNCFINGVAGQAVTPNITYNVFLFNNAGTLAFDLFGSGHMPSISAGNVGIEVRNAAGSPDNLLSLVGKISTNASSQITAQGASVLSWFNQIDIPLTISGIDNGNVNSSTPVEIDATKRQSFLTWGTDLVSCTISSLSANTIAGEPAILGIGLDSPTASWVIAASGYCQLSNVNFRQSILAFGEEKISEGLHYMTALGYTGSGVGAGIYAAQLFVRTKG